MPEDMDEIMLIVRQARNYLKKHRVDQWQGEYPAEANFLPDINAGRCFVMTYGGAVAGFFCLGEEPEPDYDASPTVAGTARANTARCTARRWPPNSAERE